VTYREAQHLHTENFDAGYVRFRTAGLGTAMTYRVMCSTYGNGELPSAALEFHERSAVTRIPLRGKMQLL
jgi:hypothetical protein